jgi:D-amino-acid dehydrogenase
MISPAGPTLRFAGTLELAGMDFSINQRRVNAIRRAARDYLADLEETETLEIWRGLRPCTPDGLPIIGRTRAFENLIVASGHAMLGMSLGPVTGKLVEQLVRGEKPLMDLTPLRVERF